MWLTTMKTLPLASQESCGAIEAYHVKLKSKLYDDLHLNELQRLDWLVHKLTTEIHSSHWLDRYADENDSFQNVKEEYIASTSWHRALQIPNNALTFDDKDGFLANITSQKDTNKTYLVWNPGSEFSFCDCEWSMQGNLCKHVIKVNMLMSENQKNQENQRESMSFQSYKEILTNLWKNKVDDSLPLDLSMAWTQQMLDRIHKLVELNGADDIGSVVNNLPLKWISKKGRTSFGKPLSTLSLPSNNNNNVVPHIKNRKRKRLSSLR